MHTDKSNASHSTGGISGFIAFVGAFFAREWRMMKTSVKLALLCVLLLVVLLVAFDYVSTGPVKKRSTKAEYESSAVIRRWLHTLQHHQHHRSDALSIFIDVGTQTGETSFELAADFTSIVAIDALPSNIAAVKQGKKRSSYGKVIKVVEAAVSDTSGRTCIIYSPSVKSAAVVECNEHSARYVAHRKADGSNELQSTTLDTVLAAAAPDLAQKYDFRVVKMDLGASAALEALNGARHLINKTSRVSRRPHVFYLHVAPLVMTHPQHNVALVRLMQRMRDTFGYATLIVPHSEDTQMQLLASDQQFREFKNSLSEDETRSATLYFVRGDIAPLLFAGEASAQQHSSCLLSYDAGIALSVFCLVLAFVGALAAFLTRNSSAGITAFPGTLRQ